MKKALTLASALMLGLLAQQVANATITQYTSQSSFLSAIQPGSYLETFESYSPGGPYAPINFAGGGFTYTASAPQGLWINNASGLTKALSNNESRDDITLAMTSANVSGAGGNFYASDISGGYLSGTITIALANGGTTTYSFVNPLATDFIGFTTDVGTVASLIFNAGNIDGAWPTLDNFIVGSAVPEPTTMLAGALLLLPFGASTIRILRKRRTA